MNTKAAAKRQAVPDTDKLSAKYGCGPVHFSGRDEALYERHFCSTVASIWQLHSARPV